jgi:hypothetical protein
MKNLFAKLGVGSILSMTFLLGGLLFCTTSVQAQSVSGAAPSGPIKTLGTWKTVDDATTAVTNALSQINTSLDNGSYPNVAKGKYKVAIYQGIYNSLSHGVSVPDAAFQNYYQFAPTPGVDRPSVQGLNASDWSAIYTEMLFDLQKP